MIVISVEYNNALLIKHNLFYHLERWDDCIAIMFKAHQSYELKKKKKKSSTFSPEILKK